MLYHIFNEYLLQTCKQHTFLSPLQTHRIANPVLAISAVYLYTLFLWRRLLEIVAQHNHHFFFWFKACLPLYFLDNILNVVYYTLELYNSLETFLFFLGIFHLESKHCPNCSQNQCQTVEKMWNHICNNILIQDCMKHMFLSRHQTRLKPNPFMAMLAVYLYTLFLRHRLMENVAQYIHQIVFL